MANYFSPGVYVEDVPPSSRPIAGVGTSTAAFIGAVSDDVAMPPKPDGSGSYPVVKASTEVLVTSWNDDLRHYCQRIYRSRRGPLHLGFDRARPDPFRDYVPRSGSRAIHAAADRAAGAVT